MLKQWLIIIGTIIVILVEIGLSKSSPMQDHMIKKFRLGNKSIQVELVLTDLAKNQGLSGRQVIGADGMLFINEPKRQMNMWMKDMLFDLDMLFINDGKIVQIIENVAKPLPLTSDNHLPIISSNLPVEMVLELPAGYVNKNQLQVGDLATF